VSDTDIAISEDDYLILQRLADDEHLPRSERLVALLYRNRAAHWTICPRCGVSDFEHAVGCELALT
jgi:hypothetical protein